MPLALIDISLIDHGTRLREVSEAQVESLVDSIAEIGLLNPITVYERPVVRGTHTKQGFGIIAGAHRKVACERLGLAEIAANVVTLSELQRQIAECDENLRGPVLGKADRALFTQRRKEAYEALHPQTKAHVAGAHASNAAQGNASANLAPAFTADTASATGQSERAVQRDAERGKKISERALELVRTTKLDTGSYLDDLKTLSHSEQVEKVKADLAKPKAAAQPKLAAEPISDFEAVEKQVAALMSAWNKASPEARAEFMARIDAPIMDSGRFAA